jgi:hypothetical protein
MADPLLLQQGGTGVHLYSLCHKRFSDFYRDEHEHNEHVSLDSCSKFNSCSNA